MDRPFSNQRIHFCKYPLPRGIPPLPAASAQMPDRNVHEWSSEIVSRKWSQKITGIRPVRLRPWSAVYCLEISNGTTLFLKVPSKAFRNESAYISLIQEQYPDHCVVVVARSEETGAFISLSAGDQTLRQTLRLNFDVGLLRSVVAGFADMQMSSTNLLASLVQSGAPDLSDEHLIHRAEDVLEGAAYGRYSKHNQGGKQLLSAFRPRFLDLCDRLKSLGQLVGIEHGDFQDNNIVAENVQWRLLDWADLSVAHPFFSLATLCHSMRLAHKQPVHLEQSIQILIGDYIAQWPQGNKASDVDECLSIIHTLFPLLSIIKAGQLFQVEQHAVHGYAGGIIDYWVQVVAGLMSDST